MPTPPQVYKSNALIEASYRLSVAEQRIMLACISQVRRDQPITDEVLYSVTATEIAAMSGSTTKAAYAELEKAALRLKRREVWLTEKPNGDGKHEEVLVTGWVQSIRYIKHAGRVDLRFSKDMLPYINQLNEQFSSYALSDVAKMTSAYAIRLYELLIQWRKDREREIEIEWLREALQLDDKYSSIRDLKRWVIEPAVKQINEHSPLWVKWDQRKTGRRVSHLIFKFGLKHPEKPKRKRHPAPKSEYINGIPKAEIERHARPGETYEQAADRLKRLGIAFPA